MKIRMTMKRWMWILVMAPVMWVLWRLVLSADRLHAWQYNPDVAPPTTSDFSRAAITFWVALLTPVIVGLTAAAIAFRRKQPSRWPVLEMTVVALPYLIFMTAALTPGLGSLTSVSAVFECAIACAIVALYLLVGGAVVLSCSNMAACVGQRTWGRLALSTMVLCAGLLYLFWLNFFIIYRYPDRTFEREQITK